MKNVSLPIGLCFEILLSGCSRSNNLFLGRLEAEVAGHTVVVTDCYRTSVPPPQIVKQSDGVTTYRFTPCRDADVVIKDEQLTVNGRSYGTLTRHDTVIVDHGRVIINGVQAPDSVRR